MKTPFSLSFIFVRSLSFHPSLLILSPSLSLSLPYNSHSTTPFPICFASSRSSNFSLNRSYYVHPFPSIYFRLFISLKIDQQQYDDDDDDDTSLFILYFPPFPSSTYRLLLISPRHPLRQLVQTSSQTASKFLKARHRHRGEIGLFVSTPRIP